MKSKIFIGRDNTLNHLKCNFRGLLEGNGHTIFISGGPGIGKSTVVNRFLETCSDSSKLKKSNLKSPFYILKENWGRIKRKLGTGSYFGG